MLATEITTHIADALARMLQQYKAIPPQFNLPITSVPNTTIPVSRFSSLIVVNADQFQDLENATFSLDAGRQLFNGTIYPAVGAQLDGIGELVGISRNGLIDAEYLVFILGTIAENYSDTTIAAVTNVVTLLFQVSTVISLEFFPAEMAFELPKSSPLQAFLYPIVSNIVQKTLGAGIGLGFLALYPTLPFQFTYVGGPKVGGGFGSTLDPSAGGGFAGNIYNNFGA